jgi:UDP-N-acetylmuramoylalanine--D-glutamate ligase
VIDRIDRDTVAAAGVMRDMGADVVLVARSGPSLDPAALADARAADLETRVNREAAALAPSADVLIVHDYTSPREPFVVRARASGQLVTHWAQLMLELARGVTVGVTGSAGKSTTARMVATMAEASSMPVAIPTRHALSDGASPNWELWEAVLGDSTDVLVLELASSHLEYLLSGPDVAIVTTISPDHLEWHGSWDAYFAAKCRILDAQANDGWAVINCDELRWRRELLERVRGRVVGFGCRPGADDGVYMREGSVVLKWAGSTVKLLDVTELGAAITHPANALAAAAGAKAAGAGPSAIARTLTTFPGLAARFELAAFADGVSVINDGMALTPRKALAALAKMADGSVALICGGDDHLAGWSVEPLHTSEEEQALLERYFEAAAKKARHAFVVGPTAERMRTGLIRHGLAAEQVTELIDFDVAVARAVDVALPGDTVLLAPVFGVGEDNVARFNQVAAAALANRR